MNREFARHLPHAHYHLHEAALSLTPSAPRKRLRDIECEWRALIVECLFKDPAMPVQELAGPSGSGRINIEE